MAQNLGERVERAAFDVGVYVTFAASPDSPNGLTQATNTDLYAHMSFQTDAQLKAIGYGESRQVVPGAERDDTGAEMNRRVVFVVETKGDSTATNMTASALR